VVQGGGNMPAYGKNLNPAEVAAVVSFLDTLHPANQPPARDAAQGAIAHPDQHGANDAGH
jgi:ubiquinol-cytochrome c reductase cytochrome b subunit